MLSFVDAVGVEADVFKDAPHADIDQKGNIHICE